MEQLIAGTPDALLVCIKRQQLSKSWAMLLVLPALARWAVGGRKSHAAVHSLLLLYGSYQRPTFALFTSWKKVLTSETLLAILWAGKAEKL